MEDLSTFPSKRGDNIPAGDISCKERGSTLIIRLACVEEVAHVVHYAVWSVYGNSNCCYKPTGSFVLCVLGCCMMRTTDKLCRACPARCMGSSSAGAEDTACFQRNQTCQHCSLGCCNKSCL